MSLGRKPQPPKKPDTESQPGVGLWPPTTTQPPIFVVSTKQGEIITIETTRENLAILRDQIHAVFKQLDTEEMDRQAKAEHARKHPPKTHPDDEDRATKQI
jgi:hypothetical protein